MMNKQETWKMFIKKYSCVLMLLGLAITCGTFYAVYQYKCQAVDGAILRRYLESNNEKAEFFWTECIESFWNYYYKFLVIWALGEVSYLLPVAFIGTFLSILAYSYAITCTYIYYGVDGIRMSMRLFIFQGTFLNMLLLRLNLYQIKAFHMIKEDHMTMKWQLLLEGAIGSMLITMFEKLLIYTKI